ncbi:aldo/keto reductase [Epibacterium ulvae]|uniref:D-threo-aldose 1-dehydrogenase n=1 Tax=Epibacterium ulvae TaxID=1156985 RepID=A0A1G5Q674_9RHOB|nr:aldo/keto reductase [Epibacterium ulvae]SCZ57046.1 D-threo-aldose 1-dehydrogenase [Epibacterium ulvae]
MKMELRPVGQTDLSVTSLSFGASSIGNMGQVVSEQATTDVLAHAWRAGIRYFDTAPHYGRGLSETRLGRYLSTKPRDEFVLSTKVGRVLFPGPALEEADGFMNPLPNAVRYDYSADGIMESFEGSCKRLGTSNVEILFVHDIGDITHGAEEGHRHFEDLMGSGFQALKDLKQSGRVQAIGLGVNETQVCLDVMEQETLDVILLAGRLTLLDRQAEENLLAKCKDQGTSLVLGGIFNSGILATGPKPGAWFDYAPASEAVLEKVRALEERAQNSGLSLAEASVQFALLHPAACSVLLGTGKVSSLQRNMDAAVLDLDGPALEFVTT